MTERLARCACGQLQVAAVGDPLDVGVCSCQACQRRTGSVISPGTFWKDTQLTISGESRIFQRVGAETGLLARFHFCPTCGTTVYWGGGDLDGVLAVALGCFADPAFPKPMGAVYAQHRPPWLTLGPGIPDMVAV